MSEEAVQHLQQFWVFKLMRQTSERIRRERPFEKFMDDVRRDFKAYDQDAQLDEAALRQVYSTVVEVAANYQHCLRCEMESATNDWKRYRQWAREPQAEHFEQWLQAADQQRASSYVLEEINEILPHLSRLRAGLWEMRRHDDRVAQFGALITKQQSIARARRMLRDTMAVHFRGLPQSARFHLIGAAMKAIELGGVGMNLHAWSQTIERSMRREDARFKSLDEKSRTRHHNAVLRLMAMKMRHTSHTEPSKR